MSRQGTLTNFLKIGGAKRTSTSSFPAPKKSKTDSTDEELSPKKSNFAVEDLSFSTLSEIDINCLTPSKIPPHQVRKEINALSIKYPIIDKDIGLTWYSALSEEFKKPYFSELNNFVLAQRSKSQVYPPIDKVWTWTRVCPMNNVKAVILGQDPYHNPNQAHGLCFSVALGVPPPPSLLNMYKELETDIEGFVKPKHGYLIGWARQGVLLLNSVLTVTKNSPNSHKDMGWENLTTAVIKHLNNHYSGIVFFLWGSYAQKKADFVDKKKHLVLKSVHPSPLSAARGWFGSKHFSKCNDYLKGIGKDPIHWADLPPE